MSAAPRFKVYNPDGEYVAACKFAEDAAAIVAAYGDGATIRYGHRKVVFREGSEGASAGDSYDASYDAVAAIVYSRAGGEQP